MTGMGTDSADAAVASLAEWMPWVIIEEAAEDAPRAAGVYLARQGRDGPVVYVGTATDSGGTSLRSRFARFAKGKGSTLDLGEVVLNRALNDPAFIRKQLEKVEAGGWRDLHAWSRAAFDHQRIRVTWAIVGGTGTSDDEDDEDDGRGAAVEALARRCREAIGAEQLWTP